MQHSAAMAYPITDVCVVADPRKCPPQYELLLRSNDKKDDCDLWKDGVFKSRVTRYLCFSRLKPTCTTYDVLNKFIREVVVDITIQNDKEIPPAGYRLIEKTVDTGEKATNKKQICIKTVVPNLTTDAVSDIILLSKSKRAPVEYTSAGDLNGFLLCFKISKIPIISPDLAQPSVPDSSVGQLNNGQPRLDAYPVNWWGSSSSYQSPGNPKYSEYCIFPCERGSESNSNLHGFEAASCPYPYGRPVVPSPTVATSNSLMANSASSTEIGNNSTQNPLSGVPFRLNPRFSEESTLAVLQNIPSIHYKSLIDIENEFNYVFNLENTTVK